MTKETIHMKAIVVTDQAAGTAGMKLVERPEPEPSINDVVVQVYASGFVNTELGWPSTWTDRLNRDRTPSIPGHELAGVVTALGYGTTGLSVGQRVFGLTDWSRDGTLAEYAAVEARNLAPLPGDVDFTVGASLPISGLTAWQGLIVHGRLRAGQRVIAHGAAGHSLRRQFATEMKAAPLKDLCALGGWKSPQTVLTCYQRADSASMQQALAARRRLEA
jgi:NADPH:quinone reductase-like Zn-dependent oxidoreductase